MPRSLKELEWVYEDPTEHIKCPEGLSEAFVVYVHRIGSTLRLHAKQCYGRRAVCEDDCHTLLGMYGRIITSYGSIPTSVQEIFSKLDHPFGPRRLFEVFSTEDQTRKVLYKLSKLLDAYHDELEEEIASTRKKNERLNTYLTEQI